jgi:hypothetical protein
MMACRSGGASHAANKATVDAEVRVCLVDTVTGG